MSVETKVDETAALQCVMVVIHYPLGEIQDSYEDVFLY